MLKIALSCEIMICYAVHSSTTKHCHSLSNLITIFLSTLIYLLKNSASQFYLFHFLANSQVFNLHACGNTRLLPSAHISISICLLCTLTLRIVMWVLGASNLQVPDCWQTSVRLWQCILSLKLISSSKRPLYLIYDSFSPSTDQTTFQPFQH